MPTTKNYETWDLHIVSFGAKKHGPKILSQQRHTSRQNNLCGKCLLICSWLKTGFDVILHQPEVWCDRIFRHVDKPGQCLPENNIGTEVTILSRETRQIQKLYVFFLLLRYSPLYREGGKKLPFFGKHSELGEKQLQKCWVKVLIVKHIV